MISVDELTAAIKTYLFEKLSEYKAQHTILAFSFILHPDQATTQVQIST
jgi:hypothetical protein